MGDSWLRKTGFSFFLESGLSSSVCLFLSGNVRPVRKIFLVSSSSSVTARELEKAEWNNNSLRQH